MDELTPLFAIEAEQLLLSGFVEEAIELCNKGLNMFPDYPTAKVILARAYHLIGNNEQSELVLSQAKSENYGKVLDKFSFDEAVPIVKNEIIDLNDNSEIDKIDVTEIDNLLIGQENEFDTKSTSFVQNELDNFNQDFANLIESVGSSPDLDKIISAIPFSNVIDINAETEFERSQIMEKQLISKDLTITNVLPKILSKNKDEFFYQEDVQEKITEIEDSINFQINSGYKLEDKKTTQVKIRLNKDNTENDSLKMLVMSLISTRFMKTKNNNFEEKTNELPIYTETMAKILIAQGAKDKAINIYRKLMINEPIKKEYYNSQIEKIS